MEARDLSRPAEQIDRKISFGPTGEGLHDPDGKDSLDLVYDVALKSYEVLERRYQSMDSRIQMVLSFAVGLVVVVLTLVKSTLEHPNFSSKLFLTSMGTYILAVVSALIGAFRWPVLTLRPMILYEDYRQLPQRQFKGELVKFAGEDAEQMIATIAKKRYAAFAAILLFVAGSVLLVIWALRTPMIAP